MTKDDLTRIALELPIDDQLDLAQTLWEHASPPSDFSLTPELAEVLEARIQEAHENPEAGLTWGGSQGSTPGRSLSRILLRKMMMKPLSGEGIGAQGWRQFLATKESILSQYDLARTRAASREVQVFHGRVAEAAVREWLAEFLPQRYGVTSGYIVSQGLPDTVPLKHFDIIIYDRLESPVFWVESNPDSSAGGTSRAILAEHVRAVLEVKSSFEPSTVAEAMAHLQELKPLLDGIDSPTERYKKYLPRDFATGIVFMELRQQHEFSTSALDSIIGPPLPRGYFEALILRGEGLSVESTGTVQIVKVTEGEPLVSNVGRGKESLFSKVSFSNSIETNSGHIAALLTWGCSQFSMYAFDLLSMINGTYQAGVISSLHGIRYADLGEG